MSAMASAMTNSENSSAEPYDSDSGPGVREFVTSVGLVLTTCYLLNFVGVLMLGNRCHALYLLAAWLIFAVIWFFFARKLNQHKAFATTIKWWLFTCAVFVALPFVLMIAPH